MVLTTSFFLLQIYGSLSTQMWQQLSLIGVSPHYRRIVKITGADFSYFVEEILLRNC